MATQVYGAPRFEGGRSLDAATGVTMTPAKVVKRGTAAGSGDLCGANDMPLGISTTSSLGGAAGRFEYASEGTMAVTAAGAINTTTGGEPTEVWTAANGKVQKLPTSDGTYYRVGWVDVESVAAGADGDVIHVLFDEAHYQIVVSGTGTVDTAGY